MYSAVVMRTPLNSDIYRNWLIVAKGSRLVMENTIDNFRRSYDSIFKIVSLSDQEIGERMYIEERN